MVSNYLLKNTLIVRGSKCPGRHILPPDKNEAYLVRATAETSIPGIVLELTD